MQENIYLKIKKDIYFNLSSCDSE